MTSFKKLTALFCIAALTVCAAVPASAATTAALGNPARPSELYINGAQIEVINVIDRELRTNYAVNGANDRAAIVNALNGLEYRPGTNVQPDMENLRLLQIRFQNGQKYEYWCHRNVLMVGDDQLTDGLASANLYKALDNCQKNYPANIEWLGYMNPYRITDVEITNDKGTVSYQSALSATQRDAILKMSRTLKAVKVSSVQQLDSKTQNPASFGEGNLIYSVTLKFETEAENYNLYLFDDGRVTATVGSINYALSYLVTEKPHFQALINVLAIYDK